MRRTLRLAAAIQLLVLVSAPAARVGAAAEELPNLVPLPPRQIEIGRADDGKGQAIRFEVAVANKGDYAFDLFGQPEGTESAAAFQCIAWATDRVCESRAEVGRFVWHPDHGHHHLEDFALYELRRFGPAGRPDMSARGLVATSGKVSFCIADIEQDRPSSSPIYLYAHPLYYSCLVGGGFQGISPGWRDVYNNRTTGQEIPLKGIADGRYALVVHTDPEDRFFETSDSDNVAVVGVKLSRRGHELTLLCSSQPGSLSCD